jgi:hypothetical protein
MKNREKIKVIKKGEMRIIEETAVAEEQPELNNVTKMTSTVSGWIDEFQQRRREETESAREQFNS